LRSGAFAKLLKFGFADEMAQPKRNLEAAREGLMIGPGRDQGNLGRHGVEIEMKEIRK
jgi:hypothetical protein